MPDITGYDLLVKRKNQEPECIEVKTIGINSSILHITYNEIDRSSKCEESYNLWFVKYDESERKIIIRIVNNPYTKLEFNKIDWKHNYQLTCGELIPARFILSFNFDNLSCDEVINFEINEKIAEDIENEVIQENPKLFGR